MKNKIVIMAGAVLFALLAVVKFEKALNDHSGNGSLMSISIMASAIAEEGYPVGKYCGTDECHKSCGIAPYVYTADGHYWHCKWKDTPGTCDDSKCNKPCDAMCVDL